MLLRLNATRCAKCLRLGESLICGRSEASNSSEMNGANASTRGEHEATQGPELAKRPNVKHQRARATASRGSGTIPLLALRCMR